MRNTRILSHSNEELLSKTKVDQIDHKSVDYICIKQNIQIPLNSISNARILSHTPEKTLLPNTGVDEDDESADAPEEPHEKAAKGFKFSSFFFSSCS